MAKVRCSAGGDYSREWVQGDVGKLWVITATIYHIGNIVSTPEMLATIIIIIF